MTRVPVCLLLLVILLAAVPTFCDDQQKAKKETTKIAAMATDPTGRRIVNISMADMLGLKWSDLVDERRQTGLNYGSLFVAHGLAKPATSMKEIAAQLEAGKNVFQIGDDLHCNWRQMAESAKKLNSKIDDNLYKYFLHQQKDPQRDASENYNVMYDTVKADNEVDQADIEQARDRYQLWRNRASPPTGGRLGTRDTKAAGYDHARNGVLTGNEAPAAGGVSPH